MDKPLILHIETATDICSVALSEGDQQLSLVESGLERSHATLLNTFIRKAFKQSGRELNQIDAVAISKGPGSYTGLRIGVSTAKGLTYALEMPLFALGTLENMAYGARNHPSIQKLIEKHGEALWPAQRKVVNPQLEDGGLFRILFNRYDRNKRSFCRYYRKQQLW